MIRGVIENILRPSYRSQVDIIQAYLTLPFRHAYCTLMLLVQKSGKGTAAAEIKQICCTCSTVGLAECYLLLNLLFRTAGSYGSQNP
jgi:hypothetical protein